MPVPADQPTTAPIFVVGSARSGTTMLRLMLNRHSQLAIPPESHFVAKLFRELEPDEVLDRAATERALAIVLATEQWADDWVSTPDDLRTAVDAAGGLTVADFIRVAFETETARTGKPRWGDKTPAYLFQIPRLVRAFPDAQFVITVRDPRDVYLSLRRVGWMGKTRYDKAGYIARCGRRAKALHTRFGDDQIHLVRYEDLVTDPEKVLLELCDDLDLEFETAMVEFNDDVDEHVPQREAESIHTSLRRTPGADDVERWRRELSRREVIEVEALCREVIDWQHYPTTISARAAAMLRRVLAERHRLRKFEHPLRAARYKVGRRLRDGPAPERQWLRTVMNEDIREHLLAQPIDSLDAVECSSTTHAQLGWQTYTTTRYPAFDLCDPPVEHETYDVVLCEQVLEHVIDPWRATRTLFDLCRPGGSVVVSTPFLVRIHRAPADYWRFTDDGIRVLLEGAGFDVDEIRMWGNRAAVRTNLWYWPVQRPWRSRRNVEDCPMVVWAYAHRPLAPASS